MRVAKGHGLSELISLLNVEIYDTRESPASCDHIKIGTGRALYIGRPELPLNRCPRQPPDNSKAVAHMKDGVDQGQ